MFKNNLAYENNYFMFRNGILHAEEISIIELAKSTKTPFYVYSAGALENSYNNLSNSLKKLHHSIYYSVKSNSNLAVLRVFALLGSGMDVVSGGEYLRSRKAGVKGEKIVFSGL